MSYDATLLYKEADLVVNNKAGFYSTRTEINILVNGAWIKPVRIKYMHLQRDYATGTLGDIRKLQIELLLGDYTFDLLPYRDNLIIDVTEVPLVLGSSARDWDATAITKRYKAILDLQVGDNTVLTNKSAAMTTKAQMNQIGLKQVVFTMVDEICYKLMMVTTGLTLRNMTSLDMIRWIHDFYFKQLFNGTADRIIQNNICSDSANPDVHSQLAIPDGTPLKDICSFIQNDEYGVYPTGLGRYIQDNRFYVYPLFDVTRYSKNTKVLHVINMPNDRYQGAEHTFIDTPRKLTIVVTGGAKVDDQSMGVKIQTGNGVMFGDANKLLRTGVVKKNRMLIDRATNLTEATSEPLADGLNNMRWSEERFTANPYKQYSIMAQKMGQRLDLEWTRGNVDLLEPGMPVKYQTIDDNTVVTYYGTLLSVNDDRIPVDAGNVTTKIDGVATLGLFLIRHVEEFN